MLASSWAYHFYLFWVVKICYLINFLGAWNKTCWSSDFVRVFLMLYPLKKKVLPNKGNINYSVVWLFKSRVDHLEIGMWFHCFCPVRLEPILRIRKKLVWDFTVPTCWTWTKIRSWVKVNARYNIFLTNWRVSWEELSISETKELPCHWLVKPWIFV